MSTDGQNYLLLIYHHLLGFRFKITSSFSSLLIFLVLFVSLPWSVSTGGVPLPCENGGQFDTITCSQNNKLILTLGDHYYEGDCSDYPYYVYSEGHKIHNRKTSVRATVIDINDVIYFFEDERVIIYDGKRRYDERIVKVFNKFVGKVTHAVAIPNPKPERPNVPCLIMLYTKNSIFYYGERITNIGFPFWKEVNLWTSNIQYSKLNNTIPKVSRIIGVTGNTVKTILSSSDDLPGNITYYTASIRFCGTIIYRFHFFKCLDDNEKLALKTFQGQLIKCLITHQSAFNLMTLMLWGCLLLIILAIFGLLKCTVCWLFKKFRRTKRKVRFLEDSHKGDPKLRNRVCTYAIESPQRIQSFGFDSMAQSAVSINDDYKDIDYSSDLEEEKITLQESDSKPPLESIQSS